MGLDARKVMSVSHMYGCVTVSIVLSSYLFFIFGYQKIEHFNSFELIGASDCLEGKIFYLRFGLEARDSLGHYSNSLYSAIIGEDEEMCDKSILTHAGLCSTKEEFLCSDKNCISMSKVCDGVPDCQGKSHILI